MKALAYLLGARALDAAREAETGIRRPQPEEPLEPIATTQATAAAWRRWRDRGDIDATVAAGATPPSPGQAPALVPKRA